jgi:ABC-2 type transport system permease protein
MRTIWKVIKHDLRSTLAQPSFWILTMIMPLLLLGLQGYGLIRANALAGVAGQRALEERPEPGPIGLVDESGLIAEIPAPIPPDAFVRFGDLGTARSALMGGEVEQVVVVPADYVASGDVIAYDQDFQLLRSGEGAGITFESDRAWMLPYLLNYALTGADETLATALQNPTPGDLAERHVLRPPPEDAGRGQALTKLVAQLMPYVFYFLLVMGSNYLMRAVVAEKENRTAEVLLLSVNPRDLMVGKILAMSVLLALQVAIWLGGALLVLGLGAVALQVAAFTFPAGFFVWALAFLLLGYLLFASVMAAAGAISTSAREAAPITVLIIIPLMPTLMFGPEFADNPHSPLVVALSMFPFSSPSAMVTRLAVATVPLWQVLLSLALLAATAYGFVLLAARFFRAGNLLSDTAFSLRRLATGWRR